MTTSRIKENINEITKDNKICNKTINDLLFITENSLKSQYKHKFKEIIENQSEVYFNEENN